MKRIKIENIYKEFFSLRGRTVALKDINLDVEPGVFFALLGPSGCGKSTLLNIVAGIEKPTRGSIRIGDRVIVSSEERVFLTPKERNVAMVFQSYALYPHLNVFENIAFPLRIAKIDKGRINSRVREVVELLEISHLLKAKPSELSGGQRQRVAIGRAIVRRPNLLLLDEPLSNLDAQLRINMRGELKRLQKQLGVTTLYVTHDQTEAMTLGDKLAVLKDGEIQQVGTPDEVYNDPQNVFVAKFVGTPPMNVLHGEILHLVKGKPQIVSKLNPSEILLGLRPEHVRITKHEGEGKLRGRINVTALLGTQALLYLKIGVHEILSMSTADAHFREDEPVGIDFDERCLFVFSKASGKRIKF
jgi:multiple sugar transport system ATP-binding protein